MDRHEKTFPGSIYIIKTFMEKGNTHKEEPLSAPYWSMHQDIQDVRRGLKTFDELRVAWVAWAKQAIEELENQADRGQHSQRLPEPNSADTTA
ncbi:MAG: hypothetical protein ACYDER_01185 [Ktedonobacteraceae bacterium]